MQSTSCLVDPERSQRRKIRKGDYSCQTAWPPDIYLPKPPSAPSPQTDMRLLKTWRHAGGKAKATSVLLCRMQLDQSVTLDCRELVNTLNNIFFYHSCITCWRWGSPYNFPNYDCFYHPHVDIRLRREFVIGFSRRQNFLDIDDMHPLVSLWEYRHRARRWRR